MRFFYIIFCFLFASTTSLAKEQSKKETITKEFTKKEIIKNPIKKEISIIWKFDSLKDQTWRHLAAVNSVAFSPDGKIIITGSSDKTAVLRDAASGKTLQTWQQGGFVYSVAFSPDSKRVITGSSDDTAVLRDVVTGKTLQTWKHDGIVSSVAFSPDGKKVLTGSLDKTAVLRDAESGKTIQVFNHQGLINCVAFSPDGKKILTGSNDRFAILRDAVTGETLQAWKHTRPVLSLAFSPDSKKVVTGSSDDTAVLRDVVTGETLQTWYHGNTISSISFSPDGKKILTASFDKTTLLRDSQTGEILQSWKHGSVVNSIVFSPDGKKILKGYEDNLVELNDITMQVLISKEIQLQDIINAEIKKAEISFNELPKQYLDRQLVLEKNRPIKDEFESTTQFNTRITSWNKSVEKLNSDIKSHYITLGPLPLELRASAFEKAISRYYGNPELHDVIYDPESSRFFMVLKSSNIPNFRRTLSISIPNDQARTVIQELKVVDNGFEVELKVTDKNELIWGTPKFKNNNQIYLAEYTDKDFIPPLTKVTENSTGFKSVIPPPIATLSPESVTLVTDDPKLAKLQTEVLLKEREQKELAARQAEEKRLKEKLAELNRSSGAVQFNDDLPSLLAKLPKAKSNPNLYVLAVGINDYADVPNVPFADRSAKQFAEIAQVLMGAQKQNVIVLTEAEATSGRMRGRLRTLLNRLGPQDQLLFYYAGHGVPSRDGTSTYLLAQDGGPGSYEEPDLKLSQIYSAISQSKVGMAKIFIDACFSGRSTKDKMIFEGIAPILIKPNEGLPDSQRLAVITAGRSDQFSNQYKDRGHRLFSYHLMHVLLEDGFKQEITQVHKKLRGRVLNDSRLMGPEFEQEPEIFGNGNLTVSN
jgi:WD40 repeat protein